MNSTWPYIIFGVIMAHLLIGVIWLAYKMRKKK